MSRSKEEIEKMKKKEEMHKLSNKNTNIFKKIITQKITFESEDEDDEKKEKNNLGILNQNIIENSKNINNSENIEEKKQEKEEEKKVLNMRRCVYDDNPVPDAKKKEKDNTQGIGDPSRDASASFNQQGFWENLLPIISALLPPNEKENPIFVSVMSQINYLIDEEKHKEKPVQKSTDAEDDQPQVNENIEEDAQKISERIGKMSIEEIQKILEKYDAIIPSSVPVPDSPMKYDWVTEVGKFNSSTISLDIIWSTWGTPRHILKQWQMQLESKFG